MIDFSVLNNSTTPPPKRKQAANEVNLLLSHGCCVISISVKKLNQFALRAYLPHEKNQNGFTEKPPTQCLAVIFFLIIILFDCVLLPEGQQNAAEKRQGHIG